MSRSWPPPESIGSSTTRSSRSRLAGRPFGSSSRWPFAPGVERAAGARARPSTIRAMSDVFLVLVVVLIAVLVWRGPKTLPRIGEMFGRGVREAKREATKLREPGDDD